MIPTVDLDPREIARRTLHVRHALGFGADGDQKRFAVEELGVAADRYNKWERGGTPIPPEQAARLVQMFPGLTLDWIHMGGWERLRTLEAVARLRKFEDVPLGKGRGTKPVSKPAGMAPHAIVVWE